MHMDSHGFPRPASAGQLGSISMGTAHTDQHRGFGPQADQAHQSGPSHADRSERAQCLAQLAALFGRRAESDYDKYVLLDERDKLMRRMTHKVSDISKAAKTLGTSTEMCPEKERYQRIVQKRVSSFELSDDHGSYEHDRFIKDYSRSSADQVEPLPHELRPAVVLMCVMQHLQAVMDQCPEKGGEQQLVVWYDFLWNRTRAIRKDLTQQLLCDESAVHLVECCARLHIYAGYHLSHLSADNFSQKMNTENLAKCLQTLRHFYSDLRSQRLAGRNEIEFRAYDIMLNLCDPDIVLNEIRALDETVLKSAPVALALRLFTAVQSNNFALFFRLVRTTATALQVAVLHRHFYRIRQSGLRAMHSTYKSRLSTADVQRLFAFESVEQTISMAAECGMQTVGESKSTLTADKTLMHHEDEGGSGSGGIKLADRCDVLMSGKMAGRRLSQLICDGHEGVMQRLLTTTVVQVQAIRSFDDSHCYTGDAVLNRVLKDSIAPGDEQMMSSVREQSRRQQQHWLHTQSLAMLHSLVAHAVQAALPRIGHDAMHNELVAETERQRDLAEQRDREQQLHRQSLLGLVKHQAGQLADEFVNQVVDERLCVVAEHECGSAELIVRVLLTAERCTAQLIQHVCDQLLGDIAVRVHRADVLELRRRLAAIGRRIRLCRARQLLAPWLRQLRARIQSRRALDNIALVPRGIARLRPFDEFGVTGIAPSMTSGALSRHLVPRVVTVPEPSSSSDTLGSVHRRWLARRAFTRWRAFARATRQWSAGLEFSVSPRGVLNRAAVDSSSSGTAPGQQQPPNPVRMAMRVQQRLDDAADDADYLLPPCKLARFNAADGDATHQHNSAAATETQSVLDEMRYELEKTEAFNEHCRNHVWPAYRAALQQDQMSNL